MKHISTRMAAKDDEKEEEDEEDEEDEEEDKGRSTISVSPEDEERSFE